MKIEKREGGDERRILLGMIADRSVLARISSIWNGHNFTSPDANLIGDWCVKHYEKYGEPPKNAIESIFTAWTTKRRHKQTVESIERLLVSLSRDYDRASEQINSQHVLDIASRHFDKVRLRALSETIEGLIDTGDLDKALEEVNKFGATSIASDDTVDVLADDAALDEAFSSLNEIVVKYPGKLGRFFGNALERDAFISIMAPEKRGKTFWLLDIAWRAMLQRRRVVMFQCGDLSRSQMMRRIAARSILRPLKAGEIRWPTSIKRRKVNATHKNTKAGVVVEFEDRSWADDVSPHEIKERFKVIRSNKLSDGSDNFKLVCAPADTLSAAGIRSKLREWDREGWAPDVVVVDYADILAPSSATREPREAIFQTWKRLRSISQEFHCLLVTATQADAASYEANLIRRKNFSDDKRKYGQVTGTFAINQTEPEKKLDVSRLNWLALREQESSERSVVYCAGCRSAASVAIRSA